MANIFIPLAGTAAMFTLLFLICLIKERGGLYLLMELVLALFQMLYVTI